MTGLALGLLASYVTGVVVIWFPAAKWSQRSQVNRNRRRYAVNKREYPHTYASRPAPDDDDYDEGTALLVGFGVASVWPVAALWLLSRRMWVGGWLPEHEHEQVDA